MVMGDITRIDTVQQYCDLFEVEALHPLVSVVNCYEVQPIRHSKKLYNIYAVLLKDTDCGTMNYGRSLYDYEKGSMLFIAPGQVMGSDDDGSLHQPAGWALMFHPELLRGTSLAHIIKEYSYFSYNANEALHLSEQERKVVIECINNVAEELRHPIDKHSRSLIIDTMKLLFDRCIRFYDRQFITREMPTTICWRVLNCCSIITIILPCQRVKVFRRYSIALTNCVFPSIISVTW